MRVDIVNPGCGNIGSVCHWLEREAIEVNVVSCVAQLKSQVLILPGVGSAGHYLKTLSANGFYEAIQKHVEQDGRLIGICLGFQAMSDYCEEDGGHAGLGLIKGNVVKLEEVQSHNQWQPFELEKSCLTAQKYKSEFKMSRRRMLRGRVFYNHEYGFIVDDTNVFKKPISTVLHKYSGLVVKGSVFGMQFHPEKSQITGSEVIRMIL